MSIPSRQFINVNVPFASFVDGFPGTESCDDAGNLYEWISGAWKQTGSDGAALVSDGVWQRPARLVSPTVAMVEQSEVSLGATPTNVRFMRVTVNAIDDIEAGSIIHRATDDVFRVLPNKIAGGSADIPITRVSALVMVTGSTGSGSANIGDSEIVMQTNVVSFAFAESDNVRRFKLGLLTTATPGEEIIFCEGAAL